jgi:hypothetical protein
MTGLIVAQSMVDHGDCLDTSDIGREVVHSTAEGRTRTIEEPNCSVSTKVTGIAI